MFEGVENYPPAEFEKLDNLYMCGRQPYVEFRDKYKPGRVKLGVPQGWEISLFKLCLPGIPCPPDGIEIITYVDDCTIMALGGPGLAELADYFQARNIKIFATKSTTTLFTTSSAEMRTELNVQVDRNIIPTYLEI